MIFSSANNNNSISRHQSQHSTFLTTSIESDKNPTSNRDVASFSTPEVTLQNQSFLDTLSAKLSIGGNIKLKQTLHTQEQVSAHNTLPKWHPTLKSVNPTSHSLASTHRSPSFGTGKLDNGKMVFKSTMINNMGTNMNNDILKIPNSPNKNKLHTEIEKGAFNLRKTNGILYDRSAPKLE